MNPKGWPFVEFSETDFDAQDLVDGVTDQLVADEGLQQAARVNDKGNFEMPFR